MKYTQFTVKEREKIQYGLWEKKSARTLAGELGRSPSSVAREITKNKNQRNVYTPRLAHERALKKRKSRGRKDRLKNQVIRDDVIKHLKKRWSPEQIAATMHERLPGMSISHEAIYQYIYDQVHRDGFGLLKPGHQDLRSFLRRRRKRRVPKGARRCQRVLRPKGTSINQRPAIINERKRLGDWEGDSVESCGHKPGINTLVERTVGVFDGSDSNFSILLNNFYNTFFST